MALPFPLLRPACFSHPASPKPLCGSLGQRTAPSGSLCLFAHAVPRERNHRFVRDVSDCTCTVSYSKER